MNTKHNIKNLSLCALGVILAIFLIVVQTNACSFTQFLGLVASADDVVTVSIDSNNKVTSGDVVYAQAKDGRVDLVLKADKAPAQNITVRFHCEDLTAVASLGDYTKPISNYLTLTPTNYEQVISIDVATAKYLLSYVNWASLPVKTQDYTRMFKFVLDNVSDGGIVDSTKNQILCGQNADNTVAIAYNSQTNNNFYYINAYGSICKNSSSLSDIDHWNDEDEGDGDAVTAPSSWKLFRNFGWASCWTGMVVNNITATDSWSSSKFSLWAGGANQKRMVRYHIGNSLSWKGKNSDGNYVNCRTSHLNTEVIYAYEFLGKKFAGAEQGDCRVNIKSAEHDSGSNTRILSYVGQTGGVVYFKIQDNLEMRAYVNLVNDNAYNVDVGDMRCFLSLKDTTAPTITNCTVDTSTLYTNGKLRLCLRFSEPVQIKASESAPSVTARLRAVSSLSSKAVTFTYAGGSLTDTLYFETDLSSVDYGENVGSISIESFSNNHISDFAYDILASGGNAVNNYYANTKIDKTIKNVVIDLRTPTISSDETLNSITTERDVEIKVGDMSSGRLYYAWVIADDRTIDEKSIVYENNGAEITAENNKFIVPARGLTGAYWLYIKVVSDNNVTVVKRIEVKNLSEKEPFLFDNEIPVMANYTLSEDSGLKSKTILFDLTDGYKKWSSGVNVINLEVYPLKNPDAKTVTQVWAKNAKSTSPAIYEDGKFSYTLKGDGKVLNLQKDEYGTYAVRFEIIDKCGNTLTTSYQRYLFDMRDMFDVTMTPSTTSLISGINAYSINTTLTFSVDEVSEGSFELYRIYAVENGVEKDYTKEYYEIVKRQDLDFGYDITFKKAGGFIVEFAIKVNNIIQKYSNSYTIYITDGFKESTSNYAQSQGNNVLTLKVFKVSGFKYHYMQKDGEIVAENYNDCSAGALFSSSSIAREYIKFMESQDLYLEVLTPQTASFLINGGSNVYVKANEETTTPMSGQVWARYKRSDWTVNSSTSGWVYYYFGTSTASEVGIISSTYLTQAINSVTKYIIDNFGTEIDLVGSSYRDSKTKAPSIKEGQGHAKAEYALKTKTGMPYVTPLTFGGDSALYDNVVYSEACKKDVPLVTNVALVYNEMTRLYYSFYNGATYELEFKELAIESGTLYRDILQVAGTYVFRECDLNGINQYFVYIDTIAPKLGVRYRNALNKQIVDTEFTSGNDKQEYTFTEFTMFSFTEEVDECAYVAVYDYRTQLLKKVYYKESLSKGVDFDSGSYYLEIGDRSGNIYVVTIKVNSKELEASVTLLDSGDGVLVTCNRSANEIYSYKVSVGGKILSEKYEQSAIYREGGYYTVEIIDIYQNKFYIANFEFKRATPEVIWYYVEGTRSILYVEGVTTVMSVATEAKINNTYQVVTSRLLVLNFAKKYSFEFNAEFVSGKDYVASGIYDNIVTIKTLSNWTIKIWNTEFPENYVIFECEVDCEAPEILVEYQADSFLFSEEYEYRKNRTIYDGLEQVIPKDLVVYSNGFVTITAKSGDVVSSTFVKLQVTDNTEVGEVQIFLDGVLLKNSDLTRTGAYSYAFTRYGVFKIVATDRYGNASSFTFENTQKEVANGLVDSEFVDTSKDTTNYGNENLIVNVENAQQIFFLVGNSPSEMNKSFVFYTYKDGKLYPTVYKCFVDPSQVIKTTYKALVSEDAVFDIADNMQREGVWYKLDTGFDTFNLFAMRREGKLSFKVEIVLADVYVEARVVLNQYKMPFYCRAYLSQRLPNLEFQNETKKIDTTKYIAKTNTEFRLVFAGAKPDDEIVEISYAFSKTTSSFEDYQYIYHKKVYTEFQCGDTGFYHFIVKNVFGNTKTYLVQYSNTLIVELDAYYEDNTYKTFSIDYKKKVYSNMLVAVQAYDSDVKFEVLLDGQVYENFTPVSEDDYFFITLFEKGEYVITITDSFGNKVTREASIKSTTLEYKESFVYGFNEMALKRSEGYTNQLLSIDKISVLGSGIKVITMKCGGKELDIYDEISESGNPYSEGDFEDVVGIWGDGKYTLNFRDQYGTCVEKTFFYKETPQLVVLRKTMTETKEQECDIEVVLKNGVYSNNTIQFTTEATQYVLTINQKQVVCPHTLSFATTQGQGTFEYIVYYLDDYGFYYEFKAVLMRKDIEIVIPSEMKVVMVNGVESTKDNVQIEFEKDATCAVVWNGQDIGEYISGDELTKDGEYRFVVVDKAGNVASKIIKKDTVCEYSFYEDAQKKYLVNGDVATTNKVIFASENGDSADIYSCFLNGVLQEKHTSKTFSEAGKWEVVVKDGVDNYSYFKFYIVTTKLGKFEYTSPYNYIVSELYYESGEGKTSIIDTVIQKEFYSQFTLTNTGLYSVYMVSQNSSEVIDFKIKIDTTPPQVSLVGCENGEKTINEVSLAGYEVGDTVDIYKDGELLSTQKITSVNNKITISDGGQYKVVVTNVAGISTEFEFTKVHIMNTAGSVLIIILALLVATGLFFGLLYRNRSKVDKF